MKKLYLASIAGAILLSAFPLLAAEKLISAASPTWSSYGMVRLKIVERVGTPDGKALRLTVTQKGANAYDAGAIAKVPKGMAQGDTVTFGFLAASAAPDKPAWVYATVQENSAPYSQVIGARVDIDDTLRFYCVTGPAKMGLKSGKATATLHVAGTEQVIDLGAYLITTRAPGEASSGMLPCQKTIAADK